MARAVPVRNPTAESLSLNSRRIGSISVEIKKGSAMFDGSTIARTTSAYQRRQLGSAELSTDTHSRHRLFFSKKWRSTEGVHTLGDRSSLARSQSWARAIGFISGSARYWRIAEFPRFVTQPRHEAISLVDIRYRLLCEEYVPMAAASKAERGDQPTRH